MKQKYLLENEQAGEDLLHLRFYLAGSTFDGKTYSLRMGDLTNVFRNTTLFAYDLPELVEQFPNNFMVGKNLFINAKFLNSTNQNSNNDHKDAFKEAITVISSGLLDIKNTILNIPNNLDDKTRIISNSLSMNNLDKSLLADTPSISVKELDNILINAGLPLDRAEISKIIDTDVTHLKEVLLSNNASYRYMPSI